MNTSPTFYPGPANLPLSSAVRANGFLMLSGQIPLDADKHPLTGPIEVQTHAVLKSIAATLESLGSSLDQVVKVNVWLSDIESFSKFNEVYRSYFKPGRFPVRSLVQSKLAFGVGVEIETLAVDGNTPD